MDLAKGLRIYIRWKQEFSQLVFGQHASKLTLDETGNPPSQRISENLPPKQRIAWWNIPMSPNVVVSTGTCFFVSLRSKHLWRREFHGSGTSQQAKFGLVQVKHNKRVHFSAKNCQSFKKIHLFFSSTCDQCITFQLRGTPTRKLLPNLPDLEGTKLEWNVKGENTTTITWMSSRSCHSWTNPHGLWKHPCWWVANPSPKNFYTPIQMFILLFATRPNNADHVQRIWSFSCKKSGMNLLRDSRIWTMKSPPSNNIP